MISVIIPVYNKDRQIIDCLNSVINQTYKNYEIIIINDGSTDQSERKILDFIENKQNVKYIFQKNQGVSSARNTGIKAARGEYIVFIDADDYIDNDYFEKLMEYKNSDLVISGYVEVYTNTEKKYCPIKKRIIKSQYKDELFNNKNFRYIIVPYLKLFHTNIIKKNGILFNNNISYGEDAIFTSEYIKYCNEIELIDCTGYKNRILLDTLSHKYIKDLLRKNIFICERLIENYNLNINKYAKSFVVMNYMQNVIYNEVSNKNYLTLRKEFKYINNYISTTEVYFSTCKELKQKIIYCLIKLRLYFLVYILYLLKK